MKVYMICAGYFPYGMAPLKRKLCLAKSLIRAGVDCQILIFASRDNRSKEEGKGSKRGEFENVPFQFIGKDVSSPFPTLTKILSLLSMLKFLLFLKRELKQGDVVYSYVHDKYTTRYMNYVIKVVHSKGAKYVRELCELPFGKGEETKETIRYRKRILEKQFPKYDGVLAISQSLIDLSRQYTKPSCAYFKLPILVEYEKYALEDRSCLSEQTYIFHSGTLTEQKDGFLGMIESFGKASHRLVRPLYFVSTGRKEKSPFSEQIGQIIKKYGIEDKVSFLGFVDNDTLKDYLGKASLVIINKYPTQQNKYCFSTKLGEYMAAGKPIIITNVGEAMNWLTDKKDAIIIPSQDTDALADAIVELVNDDRLRRTLGQNARVSCKQSFDYKNYGEPLKRYFIQLSNTQNDK